MKKIRINTNYSETNNKYFYRDFQVIDELPKIGDSWGSLDTIVKAIEEVKKDIIQSTKEAEEAKAYKIITRETYYAEDDEDDTAFVAIVPDEFEENRIWYAVMKDHDDDDWGTGSFDLEEAKQMVIENKDIYPDGYIAVISDNHDPICIDEIEQEDF